MGHEVDKGPQSVSKSAGQTIMPSGEPTLLIATRVFGASGQPWLWRQAIGLRGFRKELVCWERQNPTTQPSQDIYVHILANNAAPYDGGAGRWWYRLRNLPQRNFYAALGHEKRQVHNLIQRISPAVLLCNFGDIAMRLLPIAWQHGVPVVAYFHDAFCFLSNRWYRWSLYQCLRRLASIIVVTEAERQWMLEHGAAEDKVHLIPCGAPTEIFRPADRKPDGTVQFVIVSRLTGEKGCDLSIKAFSEILDDSARMQLHIYGDGPVRTDLELLVDKLGLKKRVFFHGYVDENNLARKLPLHDVFIQHSRRTEGSPVSIVEAMACGLSVIATPVGGITRQVINQRTGMIVPKGDVSGMATAMRQLAVDPELRRRLGQAGRERATALYDSSLQLQRLEKVLACVAVGRGRRSATEPARAPALKNTSASLQD